jgi:hypothetical protein
MQRRSASAQASLSRWAGPSNPTEPMNTGITAHALPSLPVLETVSSSETVSTRAPPGIHRRGPTASGTGSGTSTLAPCVSQTLRHWQSDPAQDLRPVRYAVGGRSRSFGPLIRPSPPFERGSGPGRRTGRSVCSSFGPRRAEAHASRQQEGLQPSGSGRNQSLVMRRNPGTEGPWGAR